jgi:hypothetical protein
VLDTIGFPSDYHLALALTLAYCLLSHSVGCGLETCPPAGVPALIIITVIVSVVNYHYLLLALYCLAGYWRESS